MRKRDAIRNMLLGWALIGLALLFTLSAWAYIELFRALSAR